MRESGLWIALLSRMYIRYVEDFVTIILYFSHENLRVIEVKAFQHIEKRVYFINVSSHTYANQPSYLRAVIIDQREYMCVSVVLRSVAVVYYRHIH